MKRFFLIVMILSCATALTAGSLDKVIVTVNDPPTNSTTYKVTGDRVTGYLERIDTYFLLSTTTVNIAVSFSNTLTGLITTVFDPAATCTGAIYYPRCQVSDKAGTLTNTVVRFPLLNEIPYLSTVSAEHSNQVVRATIIYERP